MQKGMSPREVEHLLYNDCGLKGLSGVSNDVRDLLASESSSSSDLREAEAAASGITPSSSS